MEVVEVEVVEAGAAKIKFRQFVFIVPVLFLF